MDAYWSEADMVQVFGSVNASSWISLVCSPFATGSSRKFSGEHFERLRNIRVLIDGSGSGHGAIKQFLVCLPEIEELFEKYKDKQFTEFDLCLQFWDTKEKEDLVLLALRNHKELYATYKKTKVGTCNWSILTQLAYSSLQRKKFKELYNFEMDTKAHSIFRALVGLNKHYNTIPDGQISKTLSTSLNGSNN